MMRLDFASLVPSRAALAGFCAVVLVSAPATGAGNATPDPDLPMVATRGDLVEDLRTLRFKARAQGSIPVILGLRMKSRLDVELDGTAQALQRARIAAMQDAVLGEFGGSPLQGVKRFRYSPHLALTVSAQTLEQLLRSERVSSIEEDTLVKPALAQSVPLINADKASAAGYRGDGWTVAVLDTGVQRDHPFLGGRVVHEACFSTTHAGQGTQSLCPNGSDEQIGVGAATPCASGCSHGTHVAGIVAGSGEGLAGAAPGASIIAIQVFSRKSDCSGEDCVLAYSSDWMRALEHVYAQREQYSVASANMSLGGGEFSEHCDGYTDFRAAKQVIDNVRSAGIATVVASGNDGFEDAIAFPACISSAVSVGGTWDTAGQPNSAETWNGGLSSVDEVAAYSNSAGILDLLAPGSAIQSSVPGAAYATGQGTSMSAPHVAGCWAVLKHSRPAATVEEIELALKATGAPVLDWRNGVIKPRIDCKAALDRLSGSAGAVPTADLQISASSVSPASLVAGEPLTVSASVKNAGNTASGATTLRYYRSTDATIGAADALLACPAVAIGVLSAGAFVSAPVCHAEAPAVTGTYYYGACVAEVAGEADVYNNCSHGHTVSVVPANLPDLVPAEVRAGSQAHVGGTLPVSLTVANRGSGAAGASKAHLYLSGNGTISSSDTWLAACDLPAIMADATDASCSLDVTVPTTVMPGAYYLGVVVDAGNLLAESNEANNLLASSTTTVISNVSAVPALGDGTDAVALSWVTGGDADWTWQAAAGHDGGDAVRSGVVGANQISYLQTTVTGPGNFSFYWKVSSEQDYDALALVLDSELVDYITGETGWAPFSLAIPAGTHTLTWAYVKDDAVSGGEDAGWVDRVAFTPGGTGLFVSRSGFGTGRVSSSPAGIDCGTDCSESFTTNANVTLTARPDYGYVFAGWSGACSGTAPTCSVAMSAPQWVTALFTRVDDAFPYDPLPAGWSLHPIESDEPWSVASDRARGGRQSLKSAVVGDNGVSAVTYSGTFREGYVRFAAKVSSEADYDYFLFMIDDELVDYGSGEIDWTEVSYPISAGAHTLTWAYVKDESWTDGADAAWIDSVSLPLDSAHGALGTPAADLTVSGIGVISGYHCSAKDIDVYIDGVHLGKAGAGTRLLGTWPICGHADTGFSLLYNFNNLANGHHTLAVYADGRLLETRGFTSLQSGGVSWLAGASRTATVEDFPQSGQTATLEWVQSYQNFLITGISDVPASASVAPDPAAPAAIASVGLLGTPVDGSTASGIGVISGYHCTSGNIDVYIDGVHLGKAGAGTRLLGTLSVCGRTDTGFSLLYNFNNLANGTHVVEVYADGSFFDSHTFTSFQSGGVAWLPGVERTATVPDFPAPGQTATLEWVQPYQNFLITHIEGP